ncbi:hypothetical protein D3C81_1576750 [compost metagenome]
MLVQAQATAYFAIDEKVATGLQAQVAQRVFPQHAAVEAGRRGEELRDIIVVLDAYRAQSETQHILAQLPGTAAAAIDVTDQGFVVVLARHPLQAAGHLP